MVTVFCDYLAMLDIYSKYCVFMPGSVWGTWYKVETCYTHTLETLIHCQGICWHLLQDIFATVIVPLCWMLVVFTHPESNTRLIVPNWNFQAHYHLFDHGCTIHRNSQHHSQILYSYFRPQETSAQTPLLINMPNQRARRYSNWSRHRKTKKGTEATISSSDFDGTWETWKGIRGYGELL